MERAEMYASGCARRVRPCGSSHARSTRAHARRTGAAGGGIACGVQARTRARRDSVHRAGLSRRGQRRSRLPAAMRPASLSGAGLWPTERGPCRRPWRRSGGDRREARVRGRRGVSLALPLFLFHCPPCAPPPVVPRPCRAASERRVEPEVARREMQAPGSALASTLLAASAAARCCSAGSATYSG